VWTTVGNAVVAVDVSMNGNSTFQIGHGCTLQLASGNNIFAIGTAISGSIEVQSGSTFLGSRVLGTLTVTGGTVSPFTDDVFPNGLDIQVSNGLLNVFGPVGANLHVSGAGAVDAVAPVEFQGNVVVQNGRLTLSDIAVFSGGAVQFTAGLVEVNAPVAILGGVTPCNLDGSTLAIADFAALSINGSCQQRGGLITGNGTLRVPGSLTVGGDSDNQVIWEHAGGAAVDGVLLSVAPSGGVLFNTVVTTRAASMGSAAGVRVLAGREWIISGRLEMATGAIIGGTGRLTLSTGSSVAATGTAEILASVVVNASVHVDIAEGAMVTWSRGANVTAGSRVTLNGTLALGTGDFALSGSVSGGEVQVVGAVRAPVPWPLITTLIRVTGGSLELAAAQTWNTTFVVDSGTLQISFPTNFSQLNVSGGAVVAAADVIVAKCTQTGGSWSGAGALSVRAILQRHVREHLLIHQLTLMTVVDM
jgi:hypothetical protein